MKRLIGVLKAVGFVVIGYVISNTINKKTNLKKIEEEKQKVNKFKRYYNLLNKWMVMKQAGGNLAHYMQQHGYNTIAIYGLGEIGCRLYEDLKNTDIVIKYAVDKSYGNQNLNIPIYSPEDDLGDVDAMIVTAVFDFGSIEAVLNEKIDCPIISLEDVMAEL